MPSEGRERDLRRVLYGIVVVVALCRGEEQSGKGREGKEREGTDKGPKERREQ